MFPFNYGFQWNVGTIIFLGLFFLVVIIMGATFIAAILRTRRTMRTSSIDAVRWESDFHDFPSSARVCRHELNGILEHYTCDFGFDCRSCSVHTECLSRQQSSSHDADIVAPEIIYGFAIPADRLYYRGHTWIKPEEDGIYSVGLDDFAQRLIGSPDSIKLPTIGTTLELNGNAWNITKGTSVIRILSPLDGEVVAAGDGSEGWFLKITPAAAEIKTDHLLNAYEATAWIRWEFKRIQILLADPKLGLPLADGETPIQDFPAAYPHKNWDKIYCDVLLNA